MLLNMPLQQTPLSCALGVAQKSILSLSQIRDAPKFKILRAVLNGEVVYSLRANRFPFSPNKSREERS